MPKMSPDPKITQPNHKISTKNCSMISRGGNSCFKTVLGLFFNCDTCNRSSPDCMPAKLNKLIPKIENKTWYNMGGCIFVITTWVVMPEKRSPIKKAKQASG